MLTNLICHRWSSRANNNINLFKGLVVVFLYQAAYLQSLQVISIIVTSTEGIITNHDTALNLFTKILAAGLGHHIN